MDTLFIMRIAYRMSEITEVSIMKLLRLKAVMEATGLGRSSIYNFIAQGTFPKPVPLGDRAVGWVDLEIEEWIAERVADRDRKLNPSTD